MTEIDKMSKLIKHLFCLYTCSIHSNESNDNNGTLLVERRIVGGTTG